MMILRWLKKEDQGPCEATVGGSEIPNNPEDTFPCPALAEIHITNNSGFIERWCYHHYVRRYAFTTDIIEGTPLHTYPPYTEDNRRTYIKDYGFDVPKTRP
jgi:hypothetical protein